MTITETNPRVDHSTALEILTSLDFDPELPCEHANHGKAPWHQGPGELLVDFVEAPCVECGRVPKSSRILLCRSAYDHAGKHGLSCSKCHGRNPRETWWQLAGGVR